MAASADLPSPWYASRRFHAAALGLVGLVVVVEAYFGICARDNDFHYHRGFGQAFLEGQPYRSSFFHYPLSRGFINASLAWLPYRVDRAICYLLAVGLLAVTLHWWRQLAAGRAPLRQGVATAAIIFTLALAGPYVLRDLEDCGLQILLLFCLTAGARCMTLGRPKSSGAWLGLAAAYKLTPLIFLPYLVWKRQWQAAAAMVLSVIATSLAPAIYLGWETTRNCHQQWFACAAHTLQVADPTENGVEPPRHLNQSLPFAINRLLQTFPPGHPLALDHAWFVQFNDLAPAQAKRVIQGVLLVFGLALAWRWRRPWGDGPAGESLAPEWAVMVMLCALLSPLCWLQHLVLVLPCVLLWWQARLGRAALPRWHDGAIALFGVIALLVHRDLMSRGLYELLVSYKVHTLACLTAVTLVLTLPARRRSAAWSPHAVWPDRLRQDRPIGAKAEEAL